MEAALVRSNLNFLLPTFCSDSFPKLGAMNHCLDRRSRTGWLSSDEPLQSGAFKPSHCGCTTLLINVIQVKDVYASS